MLCESEHIIYHDDWEDIFRKSSPVALGHRLGTNFARSSQSKIEIKIDGSEYRLELLQNLSDSNDLSGIVWDAGLLLADFVIFCAEKMQNLSLVLDLGCGTGVSTLRKLYAIKLTRYCLRDD